MGETDLKNIINKPNNQSHVLPSRPTTHSRVADLYKSEEENQVNLNNAVHASLTAD